MEAAMYIFLAVSCLALILLVLVQQGKGAGVGFSMGGASQAMFGGSGGRDFFIKITAGVAFSFMLACLILGKMSAGRSTGQYEGAMKGAQVPAQSSPLAPANTAPMPAAPAEKPGVPQPAAQPK